MMSLGCCPRLVCVWPGLGGLVDVALVAFLFLHVVEVVLGVFKSAVGTLGDDVEEGGFHVFGHAAGVAADVEVGTLL